MALCPQAGQELKQLKCPLPILFVSDHSISCHRLLPHSALGSSRHVHVAGTHEARVCVVCPELAATLESTVPMHDNRPCVPGQELHCR